MAIDADQQYRLELICEGIREQGDAADVTKWERDFMDGLEEKVNLYGSRTFVSDKQWAIVDRIYDKVIGE